jgi:hypothetical protein
MVIQAFSTHSLCSSDIEKALGAVYQVRAEDCIKNVLWLENPMSLIPFERTFPVNIPGFVRMTHDGFTDV